MELYPCGRILYFASRSCLCYLTCESTEPNDDLETRLPNIDDAYDHVYTEEERKIMDDKEERQRVECNEFRLKKKTLSVHHTKGFAAVQKGMSWPFTRERSIAEIEAEIAEKARNENLEMGVAADEMDVDD